jgi:hypothetical protein
MIYNKPFPGLESLCIIETEDIIESNGGVSWHPIVRDKIRRTHSMSHSQVAAERLD